MIKLIRTRMLGEAKLALNSNITTVEEIKGKFTKKLSSGALLAQLKASHQGTRKLTDFIKDIETVTGQLTRVLLAAKVVSNPSMYLWII